MEWLNSGVHAFSICSGVLKWPSKGFCQFFSLQQGLKIPICSVLALDYVLSSLLIFAV